MEQLRCPECGEFIDDNVSVCPHCGFPIEGEKAHIKCPECGFEIESKGNIAVCPNCAFPFGGQKKENKWRMIKWIVVLSVVLFTIVSILYVQRTNEMITACEDAISNRAIKFSTIQVKKLEKRVATPKQRNAIKMAESHRKELEETLENERQERIRQEELRKERERQEAERRVMEQKKDEIISWLQGNWEWSGYIDGYRNSCRLGVSDDYAVLATPRGVLDQGRITIDLDDNTIHFGYTYIDFDFYNKRLGDFSDGMYYKKLSGGSSSSSYSGSSSGYSTTFRTSSDVMAYVSNRFKNSIGNVITIKYDGLYCNGNQITNAVRVVRFDGSYAKLSATSPYTQGTLYFTVDASRGTITDGSGDVFYKR